MVDDDPMNLELLELILTNQGYCARSARSGHQALESVAANPPDLILLDVMMPDIDGFEVCRRLKSDERTCHIPVLFISSLSEIAEKVKGFEAGGQDYITKPFGPEEAHGCRHGLGRKVTRRRAGVAVRRVDAGRLPSWCA